MEINPTAPKANDENAPESDDVTGHLFIDPTDTLGQPANPELRKAAAAPENPELRRLV